MKNYADLVFALAEDVAATIRHTPMIDLKALAKALYVQTFEFNSSDGFQTGTPKGVVTEEEFFDDLMITLHAI